MGRDGLLEDGSSVSLAEERLRRNERPVVPRRTRVFIQEPLFELVLYSSVNLQHVYSVAYVLQLSFLPLR